MHGNRFVGHRAPRTSLPTTTSPVLCNEAELHLDSLGLRVIGSRREPSSLRRGETFIDTGAGGPE